METATAFAPGHISGFFQIQDESKDFRKKGSRNCGLCIKAGVSTKVEFEESSNQEIQVFLNGEKNKAKTTKTVVKSILDKTEKTGLIKVEHSVQAPIGSGYGMSGAGTLGAALASEKVLNLNMGRDEILTEAHKAEIKCKSGLGDVAPQILGGIVIGLKPGSPPYGKWEKIETSRDLQVICGTKGSLSTSGVLNNPDFRKRSMKLGEEAMDKLLEEKNLENLMKVSKNFAMELGVFDRDFEKMLKGISAKSPLGASAVLLGKAIFAPVYPSGVKDLKEDFLKYFDFEEVMTTSIDFEGARLVD